MTGPKSKKKRVPVQIRRNDSQLEIQAQAVGDIYANLQTELFDDLIRTVTRRGQYDLEQNPYLWQMEKLNGLHMLNRHNLEIIAERSGVAIETLERVVKNEGLTLYEDTRAQLGQERRTGNQTSVDFALTALATQATFELDNMINTTLPRSIQSAYKDIVTQAVAKVVIGGATAEQAIRDTVMAWANKGFTGFTDKAGREWRADVYARSVIKSTVYKVYNEMRTRAAKEAGVDTFLYSIKQSARPACAPLQNRIVTYGPAFTAKDGTRVLSLADFGHGTAGGCLGLNCGHYLTPFVIGLNSIPELPDHLKDLTPKQAEENAKTQARQRSLERSIRRHKERLHYAQTLESAEDIAKERLAIRTQQAKLRQLIRDNDHLHRDYNRERAFIPD